jgi:hypothetical protein
MIMPSDQDYKETKLILQGKASIKNEFKPLAEWINSTYDVKTINILYDTIEPNNRPRLQICFEFLNEKKKFDLAYFSFDPEKQKAVGEALKRTLGAQALIKKAWFWNLFKNINKRYYVVDDIFVYFSAFEPIARQEANESISKKSLERLKEQIEDKNLWEIFNAFEGVTFFLYTDEQVKQYDNSGEKQRWSKMYFEILKDHDEFHYYNEHDFSISFDSKENFDNNYQSNWYYYMK